jgi:hypothetical protein
VSQWSSIYADDPIAAFRVQVGMESGRVLRAWTKAWMGQGGVAALGYMIAAIGLVCLLGCLRRLAELRFDAIYVVLYVMLLLVWPFSGEASRLSYPLLPVLLAQGMLLVNRLRLGGDAPLLRLLPVLLLGLLTLGILPALVLTARRFNAPLPPELAAARRTESFYLGDQQQSIQAAQSFTKTLHGLKEIDHFVTSENCIFAVKPSVITLYSGRSSYLPPFSSSTDESFERGIDQCRYAYLLAIVTTTFNQSLYPLQRLGDRTQPLVLEFAPSGDGSSRDVFAALVEIGPP